MNRKLLNGLLVLAVAAGGVGTFTSCKDEDFRNDVLLEQNSLSAKLEAIRNVDDGVFKAALDEWLNGKTQGFASYEEMVAYTKAMSNLYDMIIVGKLPTELEPFANTLYQWMLDNGLTQKINDMIDDKLANLGQTDLSGLQGQIDDLKSQLDALKKALEDLGFDLSITTIPTSVAVSHVFNPVFGSINLPVGINSTILASYLYEGTDANFTFPDEAYEHLAEASPYTAEVNDPIFRAIAQISPKEALKSGSFTTPDEIFGNMGGAVLAINPAINNFNDKYVVELVKSNGESYFSTADGDNCLNLAPFNEELFFGSSRAEENNLYALQVNATSYNYKNLLFDVDKSELKDAVKQAIDEKSVSSVAHLGEVIYNNVNNKLPAYAVKVSWNEGSDEMPKWNSLYSNFDLAAVVMHPLSYNTMLSAVIPSNKHIPYVSPLEDYIQKIQNKLHFQFTDMDGVGTVDLNLQVEVQGNYLIVQFTNENGEKEETKIQYAEGELALDEGQVRMFVNAIMQALNLEIGGEINNSLIKDLNNTIADINNQLKEYEAKVGDLNNYLEDIKNSKKLTYANKLVDLYNKLATKANDFLVNPNHYLQVMMAYSAGNGPHHMSTNWAAPTVVDSSKGNGLELYISSYTGGVVVPSYKKYVAITGEVYADGTVSTNSLGAFNSYDEDLNKVLSGTQERIAINVSNFKGRVIRLTYISVDYRGMCSMENYYLKVK